MVEEEEIKEDKGGEEVLKRLLESTMDYLVTHDTEEFKEDAGDDYLVIHDTEEFKEEAGDEFANYFLKLEELIDVFLLE